MYKVLVVADPLDKMLVEMDSTLRMIADMLDRDGIFQVYLVDYSKLDLNLESATFLKSLRANRVMHCSPSESNFIALDTKETVSAANFDLILLRQDPPVDEKFAKCCQLFEPLESQVLFINSPKWIWRLKEHIIPTEYPNFAIPTTVCHSLEELESAVRTQKPEAVIKPENECSGIGIVFVEPDCSMEVLKKYYDQHGPTVIVQPYLDEITKSGDLRVLAMNGTVLGSVLRVPKQGSRLANFHQGGSGAKRDASPRQLEISRHIAADLALKGIYFIGFDFIGEQLSEVNITSPTGMAQINLLNNLKVEKEFNDEIITLLEKRGNSR